MGRTLLLVIVLTLCVSKAIYAQTDYSFFPYYNEEMMEDLQVSEAQVAAIVQINQEIGVQEKKLEDQLMYKDDYQKAMQELRQLLTSKIEATLTETQRANYSSFMEGINAEQDKIDAKTYKDMYLKVYDYLKVTGEQAQLLADMELAFNRGKREGQDYKTEKQRLLKEILSQEQWRKYEKRNQQENIKSTSKEFTADPSAVKDYTSVIKKQIAEYQSFVQNRRILRNELEAFITPADRDVIAYLRDLYYAKSEHNRLKFTSSENEMQVVTHELLDLKYKEILDNEYHVHLTIHQSRAIFEIAKRLGIVYDKQIDAAMQDLRLLQIKHFGEEHVSIIPKTELTTEKIELVRNIAYLLIPTENVANIQVENAHQISLFPMPAFNSQTIDFQIKTAGVVKIEILDMKGNTLSVLWNDQLPVGNHQKSFDISSIPAAPYFYQVSSADGVSILKSVKTE